MALSVTNVEFFHLGKGKKIKAFAKVTFNNVLTISGFKIVEGDEGLFVGKPSTLNAKDEKWYDNITLSSKEAWKAIQDAILAEYDSSDGKNPKKKRYDDDGPSERSVKKSRRRDEDNDEEEERPRKKRPVEDDEESDPKPKKRRPVEDEADDDLFNN